LVGGAHLKNFSKGIAHTAFVEYELWVTGGVMLEGLTAMFGWHGFEGAGDKQIPFGDDNQNGNGKQKAKQSRDLPDSSPEK